MSIKISIENLVTGYGNDVIINDISIDLNNQDFLGIIGPNGCGKTTLLRSISRALKPFSGDIKLDGRNIYDISARDFATKVAVVPQDTFVAFDFSVLEIVLMGRSPRLGRFSVENSKDIDIALDALSKTHTVHLKDRKINALSGGEAQRVMLARALAQEPEVLLLDEPTSHLDISFQFEIMDLVKGLNTKHGLTVLAVLHDLNLASQYCNRLVMLGKGKIHANGEPEDVISVDNVRDVYGAEVWVRKHPVSQRPYVIAGIKSKASAKIDLITNAPKIHVIGGGGTASPIIAKFLRRGFNVTCGVLFEGDADQEVAEALDVAHISLPPFTQMDKETHNKHLKLIDDADTIILTDVPIGFGNLLNIEAALYGAKNNKKVIIMTPEQASERDFTNGEATKLIGQIISNKALSASNSDELLKLVE